MNRKRTRGGGQDRLSVVPEGFAEGPAPSIVPEGFAEGPPAPSIVPEGFDGVQVGCPPGRVEA